MNDFKHLSNERLRSPHTAAAMNWSAFPETKWNVNEVLLEKPWLKLLWAGELDLMKKDEFPDHRPENSSVIHLFLLCEYIFPIISIGFLNGWTVFMMMLMMLMMQMTVWAGLKLQIDVKQDENSHSWHVCQWLVQTDTSSCGGQHVCRRFVYPPSPRLPAAAPCDDGLSIALCLQTTEVKSHRFICMLH